MLQSNEPYFRVDDGIGAGLVGGAAVGAALAGGVHYGLNYYIDRKRNQVLDTHLRRINNLSGRLNSGSIDESRYKDLSNARRQITKFRLNELNNSNVVKGRNLMFGSGKAKAITYGLSAALGALSGGLIDAAND
jgi:hypothetical protein